MQIYQTHTEHGRHISETSVEAKANIKEGWKTVKKEAYYKGIQDEIKAKSAKIIAAKKAEIKKLEDE